MSAEPSTSTPPAREKVTLTPVMLNHAAWVTPDAEKTANFYTLIMGMEIASTVFDIHEPADGEAVPFFHIFFRMKDGSTLAFFEAPGLPPRPALSHPAYRIFDHIALQAETPDQVLEWKSWLEQNDVSVFGPTNHKGMIFSIYFDDPCGVRLEITAPLDANWNKHSDTGAADLKSWVEAKREAAQDGRDVRETMIELIKEQRKRYT